MSSLNKNKLNLVFVFSLSILNLILLYKIFLDKDGIRKVIRLNSYISSVQEEINRLKSSNLVLLKKIKVLKTKPEVVKRLIKKELLFVEKDEVIYLLQVERPLP